MFQTSACRRRLGALMNPRAHAFAIFLMLLSACATSRGSRPFEDYVDANGVHTYYQRHGVGPPLVLLHGAAMVAEGWQAQIEAFKPYFTVYVPERRGVGRTADVEGEWSYAGMAADTAAFMEAINIAHASVVGLSDGGIIGLILAYSHPELVGRLVVSGANIDPEGLDEFERMTPEQFLASAPPQVLPWLELQRRVSPDHGQQLVAQFAKMKRMWLDLEIPPSDLSRISAPTLVMAGDHDMFPVAHTVKIWASIPEAKLCIAPDASHFWLQEKPDMANRIILDFLLASSRASQ